MNTIRISDYASHTSAADLGPGLGGFSALPMMPQQREDVVAQLRTLITESGPPDASGGIPLHNRAVTRWSWLTIDLLARAIGLPDVYTRAGGGLGFVSGSAGDAMRLAVAAALAKAGRATGVTGTETVYVTARTDISANAAVLAAGLGNSAVRVVDTDPDSGRMCPAALTALLAEDTAAGRCPVMVVATAGDAAGAADEISAIGAVTSQAGVWLHIDAHAGAYALLPKRRRVLAGAVKAQSICLDPSILIETTIPCVLGWTTNAAMLRAPAMINTLGARYDYLGLATPERALNVALALRCTGLDRMRAHLRSQLTALRDLVTIARADPQWTMAAPPGIGCAAVRVNSGQGRDQDDILSVRVAARLRAAGLRTAHGAVLADRPVIRIAPYRMDLLSADGVWRELTAALAAADPRGDHQAAQVRYA